MRIKKNAPMRKHLYLFIFLISFKVFAVGTMTSIEPGITLYSEYYLNQHARIKGTIVFISSSGSDISAWKNKKLSDCVKAVFLSDRNSLGKSPPDLQLSPNNPLTVHYNVIGLPHLELPREFNTGERRL
ncbi:hypothetical protein BN59_02785 [Legionella massiliensis]|uniref:Uncharacterized protein n=2 Tax=Legionella massiliensis TaxID=1034943 RepID=A0A078KVN0_9GAMM|nr:hypothetical protein BN59_02785 [Legionella massiliensis]CEE14213.1 hypothetical protein BN1094_02785 [Legionella massiliensis]